MDDDCDGVVDEDVALCPFVDDASATLPVSRGAYVGLTVRDPDRAFATGAIFHAVLGTMDEVRFSPASGDPVFGEDVRTFFRPSDGHVFYLGVGSSQPAQLYDSSDTSVPVTTPFTRLFRSFDVAFEGDALLFAQGDLYRDQTLVAADVVRSFVSPAGHLVVFRGLTAAALGADARQEMAIDLSGHSLAGEPISTSFSGENAFVLFRSGMLVRMSLETHEVRAVRRYDPPSSEELLGALSDGRVIVGELSRTTTPRSVVTAIAMDGSRQTLWASDEPLSAPFAFGDLP